MRQFTCACFPAHGQRGKNRGRQLSVKEPTVNANHMAGLVVPDKLVGTANWRAEGRIKEAHMGFSTSGQFGWFVVMGVRQTEEGREPRGLTTCCPTVLCVDPSRNSQPTWAKELTTGKRLLGRACVAGYDSFSRTTVGGGEGPLWRLRWGPVDRGLTRRNTRPQTNRSVPYSRSCSRGCGRGDLLDWHPLHTPGGQAATVRLYYRNAETRFGGFIRNRYVDLP